MSIYPVGGTWYAYVVVKGRRVRKSLGTTIKQEAQEKHDRLKASLWDAEKSGATLNDALVIWLKSSPRSRNEKNAIKQFLTLYPSRPISQITAHDITVALADKSPATANRITNIVRAALNMAKAHGLCDTVPKLVRRKVKAGRLRWLTLAEWERLDAALAKWPHARAMARFAVTTGLRASNVFKLRWRDVDLTRRVTWVHSSESKSGKPIPVPLSDAAMEVIRGQIGQHDEFVFVWRGAPVSSIKTVWAKATAAAGLTDVTPHTLRHTWASWHVQAGTPLIVLKELGGWHSIEMVTRYGHLSPDHLSAWANNATKHAVSPEKSKQKKKA